MTSRFIEFLKKVSPLVISSTGIGAILLLNPSLSARYPDLRGDWGRALWIVFACIVLMLFWRVLKSPRNATKSEEGLVLLGLNRWELIREAGISLVFQVILPLTLLVLVCHQKVVILFVPHRGMPEAAVVVLTCAVVIFLLPPKVKKEQSWTPLLRQTLRAFPYLLVRASLTEETLFRGCMQTAAVQQLGATYGIVLVVTIFSVGHIYQVFRLKRTGAIISIPWGAVAFSLLFTYVPYTLLFSLLWHSFGNLLSCILLHGWIDAWHLAPRYEQATRVNHKH